jgi:nucleoside-diphosphate-sugar epimerase
MTYKILVTGGLGFVGRYIVDNLVSNGHEVSVIDDLSSNVLKKEYFGSEVELFIGDVAYTSFTNTVFSKI